jgi:RND superfamily putative drug exporter
MRQLADFCYSHRRLVLLGWVALIVGLWMLSGAFAGKFRTEFELPASESARALELLEERGSASRTGFSGQLVFRAEQGVNDPAVRQRMEQFFSDVGAALEGEEIISPYQPGQEYQISQDGRTAYAEINLSNRDQEQFIEDADAVKEIWRDFEFQGVTVELGGDIFAEFSEFSSEFIGILAAVIILLVAFGSVLAMGLPIITALFGIGCGAALIGLLTRIMAVPDFTTQVAAMIGIGVGIDYALLVVSRYRQSLHDGLDARRATILALDTSGRAVVFAGLTVVISLLGMFMMNMDFMRSLSIGAILAVLLTMLAAITLLPAMLGFVGNNIDEVRFFLPKNVHSSSDLARRIGFWIACLVAGVIVCGAVTAALAGNFFIGLVPGLALGWALRGYLQTRRDRKLARQGEAAPTILRVEPDPARSFWYKWSRVIQAHPWPALIGSTTLLIILAIPVFSLRLGFSDAGNRLETDTTRRAYDMLTEGFGPGFNAPFFIVVDTPNGAADLPKVEQLATAMRQTDNVASVADPVLLPEARLALVYVFAESSPQDEETTDLVHTLRNETIPPVVASTGLDVYTSGGPPIIVDFSDYIAERLPLFIGAVLLLSFLLLLTVFHSLVVPVKAVIMNMLSIGAAFGAMVAVFQWGVGADIIGLGKEGPIEAWGPMMMFAIVFGLSMDYEVFLLTRVREEYDRTGDNRRAVADGLAATGRVISAAAAIMVCVFGAFILGDDRALKMIGFGLAFSILIDATVVRLVLVPSAMELMGKANWWAPTWLVRYLPTIRVDTVEQPVPAATGVTSNR